MKLGMQVGLGPGHIVLDGKPAPPSPKRAQPPIFGPYPLRPNGCIDQDATCYGGDFVLDEEPAPPSPKRGGPKSFWLMFIVAKRLDGYERRYKMSKMGWFGVVSVAQGHWK